MVTTDALGRQVSTTLPFYVTSSLLQQGLSDYSVAAGSLRRDYAVRDFSYGPALPRAACAMASATCSPWKPTPKLPNR